MLKLCKVDHPIFLKIVLFNNLADVATGHFIPKFLKGIEQVLLADLARLISVKNREDTAQLGIIKKVLIVNRCRQKLYTHSNQSLTYPCS